MACLEEGKRKVSVGCGGFMKVGTDNYIINQTETSLDIMSKKDGAPVELSPKVLAEVMEVLDETRGRLQYYEMGDIRGLTA